MRRERSHLHPSLPPPVTSRANTPSVRSVAAAATALPSLPPPSTLNKKKVAFVGGFSCPNERQVWVSPTSVHQTTRTTFPNRKGSLSFIGYGVFCLPVGECPTWPPKRSSCWEGEGGRRKKPFRSISFDMLGRRKRARGRGGERELSDWKEPSAKEERNSPRHWYFVHSFPTLLQTTAVMMYEKVPQ